MLLLVRLLITAVAITVTVFAAAVTAAPPLIHTQASGPVTQSVQALADEVAAWMGVGDVVVKGRRALPASSLSQQ